ncbi:MAG: RtcB family protein [Tissierellia bacterium]|nr:RtcB family protein [Tissierellia bacterium]
MVFIVDYIELKGNCTNAKIFTESVDEQTLEQIKKLIDNEVVKDQKVRIMPDCHAGIGCVIGTTLTISDKIVPNLVGVDIGCGMLTLKIENSHIDLQRLDDFIKNNIPAGFNIRDEIHPNADKIDLKSLICIKNIDINRAYHSIGSLGGGNHFIELANGDSGRYLIIHTGSRHLGSQVANFYQKLAIKKCSSRLVCKKKEEIIASGEKKNISKELEKFKKRLKGAEKELMYLEGNDHANYLKDMQLVQKYASINRKTIAQIISDGMGLEISDSFETVHNYIDMEDMILRKGSISANEGERVLIPLNMRDGSLICIGKGNPDWNYSAPHGAGRVMSRKFARDNLSVEDFKKSMEGIYTSSVSISTLDEAPEAYKSMDIIIDAISDTVDIIERLKPVYNFKGS